MLKLKATSTKPKAEIRRQGRGFASKCRKSSRLLKLFATAFLKSGQPNKLSQAFVSAEYCAYFGSVAAG